MLVYYQNYEEIYEKEWRILRYKRIGWWKRGGGYERRGGGDGEVI